MRSQTRTVRPVRITSSAARRGCLCQRVSCLAISALILLGGLARPVRAGQTFSTLLSFDGTNGLTPMGTLVQGPDGNLYGVTQGGGAYDYGAVFSIGLDGSFHLLASFANTNGCSPHGGLVLATDGNFYGTTTYGGAFDLGTVFRVTPQGELTALVSFNNTNGAQPAAELVQGSDGSLYGTTPYGGPPSDDPFGLGFGTLFRMTLDGSFTTLVNFNGENGGYPWAALVAGPDGNLYGNCEAGGTYSNYFATSGFGTIFKITVAGTLTTLASFDGTNGYGSMFGMVPGADGSFYGTSMGGTNADLWGNTLGNIFRLGPDGQLTTIYSFDGTNGAWPRGLVRATDGNLYGMAGVGGAGYSGILGPPTAGSGTIFRVTPEGAFTCLVMLTNNELPFGGLLQASDGSFYGTTRQGGAYGKGTVFRLTVPLPPAVRSIVRDGDSITLNWSAVAGLSYQVQYCDSASGTDWNDLGVPIAATNGVMSASDGAANSAQRFYRIVLLP